jgi:hypothetical protein
LSDGIEINEDTDPLDPNSYPQEFETPIIPGYDFIILICSLLLTMSILIIRKIFNVFD